MPKSERNIISAQMEDILNAMPDGVFISDVDGTTLFVNRIYARGAARQTGARHCRRGRL